MLKMRFECDMRWEDLDGSNDVKRHCGVCDKDVFNLSGMSRERAQRLLAGKEKPCVRYISRNGRVVHNGDPSEQLRRQNIGAGKLLAGALIVQAAFMAIVDNPKEFVFDPVAVSKEVIWGDEIEEKFTYNESVVTGVVF